MVDPALIVVCDDSYGVELALGSGTSVPDEKAGITNSQKNSKGRRDGDRTADNNSQLICEKGKDWMRPRKRQLQPCKCTAGALGEASRDGKRRVLETANRE